MDRDDDKPAEKPPQPPQDAPPFEPDFDLIGEHERAPKPEARDRLRVQPES